MIIVNGQNQEISLPMDLVTYLQENNYPLDKIAIELNGQIVLKAKYAQTILNPNDKLEIVTFVGGG
ncbi:sulfur carrier protein ThiS [Megamonas funiformis]|uniref:sulfur carrier protein ThiS n=1 Tax=Megamonas funiformis TaxID=437897 RepID=UPI00388F7296